MFGSIYGDNRHIGSTLSTFLSKEAPLKKQVETSGGYDTLMFLQKEEANKYLCTM